MRALTRSMMAAAACVATAVAGGVAAGSASAAEFPLNFTASTTTVVQKLGQTVKFPDLNTTITINTDDFSTGTISAPFDLAPATTNLRLGPLTLASVGLSIVDASPVTGDAKFSDDFKSLAVNAKQTFKVKVTSIAPLGLSTGSAAVNIVPAGANCVTTPTTAALTGNLDLNVVNINSPIAGSYTIPPFTGCGPLVTPLLNTIVSGPNNPLTVQLRSLSDAGTSTQLRSLARR